MLWLMNYFLLALSILKEDLAKIQIERPWYYGSNFQITFFV